jgi:hypothetical protein
MHRNTQIRFTRRFSRTANVYVGSPRVQTPRESTQLFCLSGLHAKVMIGVSRQHARRLHLSSTLSRPCTRGSIFSQSLRPSLVRSHDQLNVFAIGDQARSLSLAASIPRLLRIPIMGATAGAAGIGYTSYKLHGNLELAHIYDRLANGST